MALARSERSSRAAERRVRAMNKWLVNFSVMSIAVLVLSHALAALAALLWLGDLWNLPLALGALVALYYLRFLYPIPVLAYFGARTLWGWTLSGAVLLAVMGALLPIDRGWRAWRGRRVREHSPTFPRDRR